MGKFNRQIVTEIKKEKEQELQQKRLREKYNVSDDVVIVEKDNTIKFFVRTTGNVIKIVVGIIIFFLTVVGIAALIFPESRNELLHQAVTTWQELREFLPKF
ncbi:MAG: hypothetical protein HFG30_06385 [Eubacterium sp.]|nr:hypothetical protein [Eubacterium sp.]